MQVALKDIPAYQHQWLRQCGTKATKRIFSTPRAFEPSFTPAYLAAEVGMTKEAVKLILDNTIARDLNLGVSFLGLKGRTYHWIRQEASE